MSSRIKTDFAKDEPLPENIFPDLNWVSANRLALYEKYGDCVVVVYQQEIIGMGKTYGEALNDAEAHLDDEVKYITPVVGYICYPFRYRRINPK